jgi:hypothetical protein
VERTTSGSNWESPPTETFRREDVDGVGVSGEMGIPKSTTRGSGVDGVPSVSMRFGLEERVL